MVYTVRWHSVFTHVFLLSIFFFFVRSDSEWRTLFFPLNMLERVDLTYIDPTWKRIEAERFTLRLQTLYMIWWYLGSEIKNQNLSILTSLKIKVTNDKWDQFEDHFFQKFFFFWDLWWSYLEINAFSLQSSWVLPPVKITKKAQSWYGKIRCEFFFGKIQVASFVAFVFPLHLKANLNVLPVL